MAAIVVSAVIPPFLVGALASRIASDMMFGTSQLGLALGACYTVTCVLSPLGGRFVATVGAVGSLRLAGAMTTLGLVGIAVATRAEHLVLVLAFIGVPNALSQPASNEILSGLPARRLRALSFGLVQASIPAASMLAGTVLAVASYGTSWRWPVLAIAGATLVAQLVLPRSSQPYTDRGSHSAAARPGDGGNLGEDNTGGWVLLAALVASGCLASAAATALPSFAATTGLATGLAPGIVASAQVAGSLGSVLVRVAAPVVASHTSLRRRLLLVVSLQLLGVLAMLGLATGSATGFVLGSVGAFAFGWGWNGLFNLIVVSARPGRVAATTGITQAGVFLGGTSGPLSFAVIAEMRGYGTAWLAMALLMGTAAVSAAYAAHRAIR